MLRDSLGIDILNPQQYIGLIDSLTDRIAFVFLLCEDQAKELSVSVDEYEERLYGQGFIDAASTALLEECHDFFLKLGQDAMAKITRTAINAFKIGQEEVQKMLTSGHLDSILANAEAQMAEELQKNAGIGSANLPPSADSTPDP